MKKPGTVSRKVTLRFMDCSVTLSGNRDIEQKALSLLRTLIQDRLAVYELMAVPDYEDDEDSEFKHKTKKVSPDIESMISYA